MFSRATIAAIRRLTLRQAFDQHYDKLDLKRSTLQKLDSHLRRWERLTKNPPIGKITDETAAEFRQACLDAGLAPASIAAAWGDVVTILRRLGPRDSGNPRGLGFTNHVPWMKPVPKRPRRPRRLSLREIGQVYLQCNRAQFPCRGVNPCDWWRALLVTAYTSGLRKGDLLRIQPEDLNLQDGSLWFCAGKTGKGDEWPLHPVAIEHIKRILRPGHRLFEGMGPKGSRFYQRFHFIQDAAGVSRFGLHDLRKTGASEVDRVERGLGGVFLQHAPRNVSEKFYLNAVDELRDAIERMRLPDEFQMSPKDSAETDLMNERQVLCDGLSNTAANDLLGPLLGIAVNI